MRRKIIGIIVGCLCVGLASGVLLAKNYLKPEVQIQEVVVEKPPVVQYIPKYIEVPVEKIVTETIEITPYPLGFDSIEELQTWLDSEEPSFQAYIGGSPYTCMDYCATMIREAAVDSYLFSQEGIVRVTGSRQVAHALCKTWIDDMWIYVEPQTRKIVEKDWK